jgi:hypothetical protein
MQNHPPFSDPQQSQQSQPPMYQPQAPQPGFFPGGAPGYPPTQPEFGSPLATPGVPVPAPGQPQHQPQSNRKKLLIGGGIGCGALLVLCVCAGLIASAGILGSTSTTAGGAPTTSLQSSLQTPTALPTATDTPNPNAGAPAYTQTVLTDSTTLSTDLNQVGTQCGNQDLSACRAALVAVRDDSQSFLDDLDAQPTPPCLAAVDTSLRAGLNDVHTAAVEAIDGIDTIDASKIQDGTSLMNKATTEIDSASSAFEKASCS